MTKKQHIQKVKNRSICISNQIDLAMCNSIFDDTLFVLQTRIFKNSNRLFKSVKKTIKILQSSDNTYGER